jgi:hypothetical protein
MVDFQKIKNIVKFFDLSSKLSDNGVSYLKLLYDDPGLSVDKASELLGISVIKVSKCNNFLKNYYMVKNQPGLIFSLCSKEPKLPKSARLNRQENDYLFEMISKKPTNGRKFRKQNIESSIVTKLDVPDICAAVKSVLKETNNLKELYEILFFPEYLTCSADIIVEMPPPPHPPQESATDS